MAERGPDVSLRDIAVAAGQRNNSAVHYHFGSRDGLVAAIVERRQRALEARRMHLLAEHESSGEPDSVRSLIDILVRPMFDAPYAEGSTHYARFLEQVRTHPAVGTDELDESRWPATRIVIHRLARALPTFTPAMRRHRLTAMSTVLFALLADYERARVTDGEPGRREIEDNIVAMIVGMLTEPLMP